MRYISKISDDNREQLNIDHLRECADYACRLREKRAMKQKEQRTGKYIKTPWYIQPRGQNIYMHCESSRRLNGWNYTGRGYTFSQQNVMRTTFTLHIR